MIASLRFPAASLAACLALAGCSAPEQPPPAPEPQPVQPPASAGRFKLDPARSLMTVVVGRAGPFARLGHEHVVSSRRLAGNADAASGRAVLLFRLDELVVDDPLLRSAAGLSGQLDADAIAGTRNNMLTKVLDAQRHPVVEITVQRTGPAECLATIVLKGQRRSYRLPASIAQSPTGLHVQGAFALRQSDFGIEPYSILGGALQVADTLSVRYDLHFK